MRDVRPDELVLAAVVRQVQALQGAGLSWRSGERWRVKCTNPQCRWTGVRVATECECYDEYALYCHPGSPGPGCPSGVVWPCPRCGKPWVQSVAPVKRRIVNVPLPGDDKKED